jgi:hypothetical protein
MPRKPGRRDAGILPRLEPQNAAKRSTPIHLRGRLQSKHARQKKRGSAGCEHCCGKLGVIHLTIDSGRRRAVNGRAYPGLHAITADSTTI